MEFFEIALSLLLPPVAVAMRKDTTGMQVGITFLLWLCGWFPGVMYALWLVTAEHRPARGSSAYGGRGAAVYQRRGARDRAA